MDYLYANILYYIILYVYNKQKKMRLGHPIPQVLNMHECRKVREPKKI